MCKQEQIRIFLEHLLAYHAQMHVHVAIDSEWVCGHVASTQGELSVCGARANAACAAKALVGTKAWSESPRRRERTCSCEGFGNQIPWYRRSTSTVLELLA